MHLSGERGGEKFITKRIEKSLINLLGVAYITEKLKKKTKIRDRLPSCIWMERGGEKFITKK